VRLTEAELAQVLHGNPDLRTANNGRKQRAYTDTFIPSEHDEQAAVIAWAIREIPAHPCLEWLFAIPNGGHRDIRTAMQLRDEGVQPGVPDLFLPVPARREDGGEWHGLWIEMKRSDRRNHASVQQQYWIDGLRANGYMVAVCYGADEAIAVIMRYLRIT